MRLKSLSLLLGAGAVIALHGTGWCSGGGAEGAAHHLNWWDFALRTANFVILVSILVKLLKKPIGNFLVSRREDIQKLLADLQDKQKEAAAVSAEYKAKLAMLDDETKKIVAELLSEGEIEKQKIIQAAERQAAYIKQQAEIAVQQEIKAARERLQEEMAELSVAAAEKLIRKSMKADDQDRLVKDFMKRVVEAK
ncbi:MAG: F0F1 ATP synthase subunit B [Syntrophobacteraceae bacterium]